MGADASERDARIDRLCAEYLAAAEAGNPPDRDAWLAFHADVAAELAEFLDCLGEVDRRIAPLRAVAGCEETIDHPSGEPDGAAVAAPPGYEILGKIAEGGMGVVYRAREVQLNRVVALKMIRAGELSGDSAVERFRREAEAAAGFDHPHIVPVYEVGVTSAGVPFFSMKLVEGRTLSDWLAEGWAPGGQLHTAAGQQRGIELIAAVARAVHYAHQHGFLHRDLKPANVLLDAGGNPYVTDFGLAKRLADGSDGRSLTQAGGLVGTLGYMAPEQARGDKALTTAADVYALGAILFHVLTGQPLRPGRTLAEVSSHFGKRPPRPRALNRRIDRDLEAICLKCLADNPAARFGSAEALADDLDRWCQGRPTRTHPPGPSRRLWMWARRRPDVAALSAVTFAVFLAGVCLVTWKWRDAKAQASRSAAIVAQGLVEDGADGDPEALGSAMLWWARSLHLAPWGYTREQAAARANLAALAGRVHTLREMWELPAEPSRMALAPDGSRAAVVETDALRLLDPRTGQDTGQTLPHPGVEVAAFGPDGATLATAGGEIVRVWDLRAPEPAPREVNVGGPVRVLAVAPGGNRLAVVGQGNEVLLFDNGAPLGKPLSHPRPVYALAFDSTGLRLATGCEDKTARVWDVATGAVTATLNRHDDAVRAVAFCPDAEKHCLLTGSDDHLARVWDLKSKQEQERVSLPHQDYVRAVAWSPDGRLVATGGSDFATQVWEAETGRRVGQPLRHGGVVEAVAFAAGGDELVAWGGTDAARVWAVSRAARAERTTAAGATVYALTELPGRAILVGTNLGTGRLDANDPKKLSDETPVPKGDEAWATAAHPGGEWVATGGRAGNEEGWLALTRADGQSGRRFALPQPVRSLSFSPKGSRLLAGTADATAGGLWACDPSDPNAAPRPVAGAGPGPVWAVAHNHDGSRYATSTGYGEVRVWLADTDQAAGEPIRQPWRVVALAFSRDGARLVTAGTDRRVRVSDASTGKPVSEFSAHRGAVWAVAVSPDGRLVATAGRDRCVRVWDADTGAPVGPPLHHRDVVWAVAFGRDGRELWSGGGSKSDTGTVRRWHVPAVALGVPDTHVETWAEVATGACLDGDRVRVLGATEWRERRDRLAASGIAWRVE